MWCWGMVGCWLNLGGSNITGEKTEWKGRVPGGERFIYLMDEYMSPVSLVFHTIVIVELILKMLLEQRHLFYTFRYLCLSSQVSLHSFSS